MKNRKLALSIFAALILSLFAVSAAGLTNVCLRDGETIYFSKCNPDMDNYVCAQTSCQMCVNEISSGVYCPASPNSCENACLFIYSADQNSTVALVIPESDAKLPPGDVKFTFQTSLPNTLDRCDLYVNDVRKRYTSTPKVTNDFTVRNMDAGTYTWRIECKEKANYGGDTLNSPSRILYIEEGAGDENATPNIALTSPAEAASFAGGAQQISFAFTISSTVLSKINECSLYLDSAVASTINAISAENQVAYNVGVGSHNWKVSCNNGTYTSETRSLTINAPAPAGGGGGGGGAVISTPSTAQMGTGFTKAMKKDEKIRFSIAVPINNTNKTKSEYHTITLRSITNASATIRIESTLIDAVLLIGEEKKFDLNADGVYDLSVILNSADKTKANLTAKTISEEINTEDTGTETTTEENQPETTTTKENQTGTKNTGVTGASVGIIDRIKSNPAMFTIIAVIIIVVIVAIFSSRGKGKEKNKESSKEKGKEEKK